MDSDSSPLPPPEEIVEPTPAPVVEPAGEPLPPPPIPEPVDVPPEPVEPPTPAPTHIPVESQNMAVSQPTPISTVPPPFDPHSAERIDYLNTVLRPKAIAVRHAKMVEHLDRLIAHAREKGSIDHTEVDSYSLSAKLQLLVI